MIISHHQSAAGLTLFIMHLSKSAAPVDHSWRPAVFRWSLVSVVIFSRSGFISPVIKKDQVRENLKPQRSKFPFLEPNVDQNSCFICPNNGLQKHQVFQIRKEKECVESWNPHELKNLIVQQKLQKSQFFFLLVGNFSLSLHQCAMRV